MPNVTIRNLPTEVHRALRVRAAENGRSTEAEIRTILEAAVKPAVRVRMGTALAALSRRTGLTDDDLAALEQSQDTAPAKPVRLK